MIAPSAGDYYINITAKDWKNLTTILKTPLNISASNELLITSLQYDNYLIENTTVNINATVNNYGSNPANNFIVGLYVDNNNIYNQTVSVNGKSSNISRLYWNATYGNHTIKAKADVSSTITEDDENNNREVDMFYSTTYFFTVEEIFNNMNHDSKKPYYCLMGAEDYYRWKICRCEHCTKLGKITIDH